MLSISKDLLTSLYIDQNLTTKQIALQLKSTKKTISKYIKKYNIPINHNQRSFQSIKSVPLSDQQIQFIIGTLLGDACISKSGKRSKSFALSISHSEKQKDYLLYKQSIIPALVNKVSKKIDSRGNSIMYSFTTISHPDLTTIYNNIYTPIKTITPYILSNLSPYAISFWLQDDGSLNKSNIRLHTERILSTGSYYITKFLYINL